MEYAAGFALGAQAAAEELELAPGAVKLWGVLPQAVKMPGVEKPS